ncbi:hypothetical protein CBM2629_A60157 [Cupriavidus taiwanensis]|nr:hypothetical protein CBM2629_A60157 [Cupriavidus taiwanensis]
MWVSIEFATITILLKEAGGPCEAIVWHGTGARH